MTLSELAEGLGWYKSRLSKYETGQLGLPLSALEEIADVFDIPPEVLCLECLKSEYPRLAKSTAGRILERLIAELMAERT